MQWLLGSKNLSKIKFNLSVELMFLANITVANSPFCFLFHSCCIEVVFLYIFDFDLKSRQCNSNRQLVVCRFPGSHCTDIRRWTDIWSDASTKMDTEVDKNGLLRWTVVLNLVCKRQCIQNVVSKQNRRHTQLSQTHSHRITTQKLFGYFTQQRNVRRPQLNRVQELPQFMFLQFGIGANHC